MRHSLSAKYSCDVIRFEIDLQLHTLRRLEVTRPVEGVVVVQIPEVAAEVQIQLAAEEAAKLMSRFLVLLGRRVQPAVATPSSRPGTWRRSCKLG